MKQIVFEAKPSWQWR